MMLMWGWVVTVRAAPTWGRGLPGMRLLSDTGTRWDCC